MSGIPMPFNKFTGASTAPIDVQQQPENTIQLPWASARRWGFLLLVIATTVTGVGIMFNILAANSITTLEAVLLFLFSITFGWITTAFWSALCGFILQMRQLDPFTLQRMNSSRFCDQAISTRTAIVMPVYNEETHRVISGFESTFNSLVATGEIAHFDFYLLSDTTDPEVAQQELNAWQLLTARLGDLAQHTFYRRRSEERRVGKECR